MKIENKRIFISDLPETATKEEIETRFSNYGNVSSVDIKERKELGRHNKSLFFAYVNLLIDDKNLTTCFEELSKKNWHGEHVQLQLARENFLERLKRERQENEQKSKNQLEIESVLQSSTPKLDVKNNRFKLHRAKKKYESSESSSESESKSDDQMNVRSDLTIETESNKPKSSITESIEKLDIKIKNNRDKFVNKSGLKIASVGKEPIFQISTKKKKVKVNESAANLKRLQSLRDMKKGYDVQKSVIKNALASVDKKHNNKIVFDDVDDVSDSTSNIYKSMTNGNQKSFLFNDDNSDVSDFETNFNVKEQFQGKSGQKLLELQSRYKNDKRFALDDRFIDFEDKKEKIMETEEISEDTLEAEKSAQLKILEEVLGKRVTTEPIGEAKKDNLKKKTMLRFDPSQPEHTNYEVTVPELKKKTKGKIKIDEQPDNQKPGPEVSKEVFYKVASNLKETLEEKAPFSLLSMFGKSAEDRDDEPQLEKEITRNPLGKSQNPFKYDSSDDEDETEGIPLKSETENNGLKKSSEQSRKSQSVFWTEPFFFRNDDYRLQEGLDFMEKIQSEDKEFLKIRRELKGIVKAKVRNNERKNKMFKKKLGGSKRRKHIRIKKALKR